MKKSKNDIFLLTSLSYQKQAKSDPQIHLWCDTCWLYRGPHKRESTQGIHPGFETQGRRHQKYKTE